MTTKVIVDNHGKFNIAVDHIENDVIIRTDTLNPEQAQYETYIYAGKHVVVREVHKILEKAE